MRTTLDLDEQLLRAARQRALDEETTLTRIVETALRALLHPQVSPGYRLDLVVRRGQVRAGVDLADRDALYELLDRDP